MCSSWIVQTIAMDILPLALLLLLACAGVLSAPMLYKLNPEEKYEAGRWPESRLA